MSEKNQRLTFVFYFAKEVRSVPGRANLNYSRRVFLGKQIE